MTHEPKHDERILDYLYGELSDAERAAFEHRLSEDQELRAEVDALGGVRAAYKKLPPAEQSADSAQRMTALLMQQAAQLHGGGGGTPDRKPDEGEIGKVLPFGARGRGLRRVLLHPASGVFAAAAVALCWVVFKERRQPNFEIAVSDTPLPQAGSPAPGPALMPSAPAAPAAPAPATPPREPAEEYAKSEQQATLATKPADRSAELERDARDQKLEAPAAKGALRKDVAPALDDSIDSGYASSGGGKKKVSAYAAAEKRAEPPAPVKTRSASDDLDSLGVGGGAARGPVPVQPPKPEPVAKEIPAAALAGKKAPAPVRGDSLNFDGLEQKPASPASQLPKAALAQREIPPQPTPPAVVTAPPPPPAAPSGRASATPSAPAPEGVSGVIAQTQARRNERVVEELANQELAGTGSMPSGSASADTYVGRVLKNNADGESARSSNRARSVDEYAQNTAPGASAQLQAQLQNTDNAPRRAYSQNGADDDAGGVQLAQLVQHIKGGRCPDAYTLLRQLEQGAPATRGLGEARSLYLRTCMPGQNQNQNQAQPQGTSPTPALQLDQNRGERQMMLEAPAPPPQNAYAPAPSAAPERAAYRAAKPMPVKRAAKPAKAKADAAY